MLKHAFARSALCSFLLVMTALGIPTAPAVATIEQFGDGFETPFPDRDGWFTTGGAGFDWMQYNTYYQGNGNAWVRSAQGWNAVNKLFHFSEALPGSSCSAGAFLRVSENVTDGYISVRPAVAGQPPGPVINEIKVVGPTDGYQWYSFNFPRPDTDTLFYVGLWGNGLDGWIQVDNMVIQCSVP